MKALEDLSGAQHAAWKLVDQSTTWNMWKLTPWLLVHVTPSTQILSLKSSSSRIALGLAIFGDTCAWQTEHFSSKAAWDTSDLNPWFRRSVLNLSGLGCPRFLWALSNILRSSADRLLKRVVCSGLIRSCVWDGVRIGPDLGLLDVWGSPEHSWLGSSTSSGMDCWFELSGSTPGAVTSTSRELWAGASALLMSDFCGLRANRVKLIRQACDGRIRFRFARSSQASHSSSALISPVPLSVKMLLRYGASPLITSFGGAIVLLEPLQAMACLISMSGINCCIRDMISAWLTLILPTRGNNKLIWWKISFHLLEASMGVVLPVHLMRFPHGKELISRALLNSGR